MNTDKASAADPMTQKPEAENFPVRLGGYWLTVVLITVAYIAAAWAGRLLALPPGYVSPLWPAAGLALAVMLTYGLRCWPGVWLGAFLFNFWLDASIMGAQVAALIATGSTLQALFGARLSGRFLDIPMPLVREGDIWRFLLLCGPVPCLVAPTVGVMALFDFGALAPKNLVTQWLNWWVGDTLGVLLFLPLLLLVLPRTRLRSLWHSAKAQVAIPLLITAILLVLGHTGLNQIEEAKASSEIETYMQDTYEDAFHKLHDAIVHLHGIERFFVASEQVTREEFNTYTQSMLRQPGIIAAEWAPRISRTERTVFEAASGAQITERTADDIPVRAGERSVYFPLLFIEPMAGNEVAMGYDLGSESSRNLAMERARDTGKAVAAAPVTLVQTGQTGLLVVVPVYRQHFDAETASMASRQAALRGFAVGVFDIDKLFAPIVRKAQAHDILLRVSDITPGEQPHVLVSTFVADTPSRWMRQMEFASRTELLEIQPASAYWQEGTSFSERSFLAFSLFAAFLVAVGTMGSAGRNVATAAEVKVRTTDLENELRARSEAEATLQATRQQLEYGMDLAHLAYWEFDVGSGIFTFNDRFYALLGTTAEREGGYLMQAEVYAREFCHPEDMHVVVEENDRATNAPDAQFVSELEHRIVRRDGQVRYIIVRYGVTMDAAGRVIKTHGANQDVTDLKRAEQSLAMERDLLSMALESSNQSMWESDLRTGRVTLDERWAPMIGEEPRGDRIVTTPDELLKLVPADEQSGIRAAVLDTINGLAPDYYVEHRVRNKAGELRWILSHGKAVERDEQGRALRIVGTNLDITERKRVENEIRELNQNLETRVAERTASLRKSEQRFANLFEFAPDAIVMSDRKGLIMQVNRQTESLFGWARAELLGQPIEVLIPKQSREIHVDLREHYAQAPTVRKMGADRQSRLHGLRKDGSTFPVDISLSPLDSEEGPLVVANVRDISERVQAEQSMREAMAMLDATEDGAFIFEPETLRFTYVNEGAVHELGYSHDELLKMTPVDIKPEFDEATFRELIAPMLRGELDTYRFTTRHRHKDGHDIPVEITLQYETPPGGQARFIALVRDVTERQRALADLQRTSQELIAANLKIEQERELLAQRVTERTRDLSEANQHLELAKEGAEQANRAKSSFLATMSHEIRTPMNGVIGMIDVLEQSSLSDNQKEAIDLIQDSALSLLGIIDDILDFSKIEATMLKIEESPMSVEDVMEKACSLLDRMAHRKGVHLTLFTDPAIPKQIMGDALRLRQVLINLVNNAIKFSGGREQRGRVSIRAIPLERSPKRVMVEFRITDNGIGMDKDTLMRLFTPFTQSDSSTTRRFGGTGLGLAISRNLVKLMDGEITVQSEPDKGSTFIVRLPFALSPEKPAADEAPSPVSGLSCLVVGGHEGLTDDLAAYLTQAGAMVKRVQDIGAAREWAGTCPPGLWVWILDSAGTVPSPDELRAAARDWPELDVRFVLIERGQRRQPRREADDLVMIDGSVLYRRALLKAVAIVAGRAQPEEKTRQHHKFERMIHPVSRDEALRQGQLILVAEDNETNQKVILHQLALLGYAADVTSDGRKALEHWGSGDYALLLADLHMPEMDGYQLSAAIRAAENGSLHIPIIALTANALKDEDEHCRAAGMDDYLSKPARLNELKAMLEKWMPTAKPRPVSSASPATTALQDTATGPVDVSILESLVGSDPEVIRDFLHNFRTSATQIATELKTACENGQAAQAGAAAHKLESSAYSVGAVKLGELCADMEQAGRSGQIDALADLLYRFETEMAAVNNHLDTLL